MPILANGKINMKLYIFLYFIFFIKKCKEQSNFQIVNDKFFPTLKKDKKLVVFFNDFISKKLIQVYPLLFDSIILFENKKYFQI